MKLSTSIFAALVLTSASAANATMITAQDTFGTAAAASGWNGDWTFAPPANSKSAAPASIKNSSLVFVGNSDSAAKRKLAEVQDADVFVDFTLQYSGVLGGNDFVGLWLGNADGPNIGLKANCGDTTGSTTCTNDLFVRTSGSGGYFMPMSDIEAGRSYQVFGHLYKSGKNGDYYDRFDAWFKNADGIMSSIITAEGKSNVTKFDTLGFRSVNIDNAVSVSIDNLRVSEVPEPGSVALMGLALAGLAVAGRRKRG